MSDATYYAFDFSLATVREPAAGEKKAPFGAGWLGVQLYWVRLPLCKNTLPVESVLVVAKERRCLFLGVVLGNPVSLVKRAPSVFGRAVRVGGWVVNEHEDCQGSKKCIVVHL